MSTSDYSKCVTANDSYIPISKRNYARTKKSKGCAQLPELQKYIETIIKANGKRHSEDTPASEKDKFPKEKKFVKRAVCKGLDNKIKCEKAKFDMSRRKTKAKPMTPLSEAVSRGVEISNNFMFEFEDPRNWKFDKNQNLGSNMRIENFLKEQFPNPYNLSSFNEFRDTKNNPIFEKVENTDLRDGTLPDVVISKVDVQTEVDFESPYNIIKNAEFEIMSNERENHANDITPTPDAEKCNPSPAHEGCNSEYLKNVKDSTLNRITNLSPKSSRNSSRNLRSNSASNLSSRISSLESVNDVLNAENQMNFKKRKNFIVKNTAVSGKKSPVEELKPLKADPQDINKIPSDYDIGKLKLLSTSDSDDSASKKLQLKRTQMEIMKTNETDDSETLTNSEINDELNKTNELSDLVQIYNVMNKATESFLLLNSKNELMHSRPEVLQSNTNDKKFTEFLNERNTVTENPFQENGLKKVTGSLEICRESKEVERNNNITNSQIENEPATIEENKNKKSLLNNLLDVALKEELELRNNLTEMSLLDKTKSNSKSENETSDPINGKDFVQSSENSENLEEKQEQKLKKQDTNQKIDEVVQFMHDFFKKVNNQEQPLQEKEKNSTQDSKKIVKKTFQKLLTEKADTKLKTPLTSQYKNKSFFPTTEKKSNESLSAISLPDVNEIKSKYTAALGELNKKQNHRMQNKKRLFMDPFVPHFSHADKKIKRLPSPNQALNSDTDTVSTMDLDSCDVRSDFFDENNETCFQIVESQNELGGYAEEISRTLLVPNADLPAVKSMFPFSVRTKRSKTDTRKTLKDVLEIEEKLLAEKITEKELRPSKKVDEKHKDVGNRRSRTVISKRARAYPLEEDFKRPNSHYVICLNSYPRNLRTVTIKPNVPLIPQEIISICDPRTSDIKPLKCHPEYRLQKFSVLFDREQSALQCSYNIKEFALTTLSKTVMMCTAEPVYLKVSFYVCKLHRELLLKNSECQIKFREIKSACPESGSPEISPQCSKNSLIIRSSKINLISTENRLNIKSEEEKPVEVLTEVLKEAEEKVMMLEKTSDSMENVCRSSESLGSISAQHSASKILRNGTSENDFEKKKIHDLLLRTYNLQQRLHRCLHKITYVQQCPLAQQEQLFDFGFFLSNKTESNISVTEFEINQEQTLPFVNWCLQPPKNIKNSIAEETITSNVQTVDCGTSYNPPPTGNEIKTSCQTNQSFSTKKNEETRQKLENDEDDKSSTSSFKSSIDFSEANDGPNQKKENSYSADRGDLIKKLFNKIELFRQSFEEERLKNQEKKGANFANSDQTNFDEIEEQKKNQLVEHDPKTTAKVLKTVFKGKKSSTELSIGLKDVPMTKVNNISVEKTKFSPNHTKISICISKETSEELKQSSKINNEILHNQFSSYYFDNMKPTMSTCQTEYSRLNDEMSKTTESINEESDEDEDDYKSVGSTAEGSETEEILEKKPKSQPKEILQTRPQKNLTKHKFDFYRKMDLKKEEEKRKETFMTSSWPRYKELEPLKKALTEMQIRMRSIKRDAFLSSNDYYERALKLAKMSAGFCQCCGTRTVIPDDTFGFYKTLLPRRCSHLRRCRPIRTALTPNSSFYSFRTGSAEVNDQFCDLNIKHSSSYMLNRTTHLRSSVHDMPILFERI